MTTRVVALFAIKMVFNNSPKSVPQICNLTDTCVVYPSNVDAVHSGEDTLNVKIVAIFFLILEKKR